MVGCHRRDATPVVDAGIDQLLVDAGRQVGGRLDVHLGTEDQAGPGDGPAQLVEVGLVSVGQLGVGLGAEVLDDHFLDVTVLPVQVGDGTKGIEPFLARLADADENAGGERHLEFAGQTDRLQSHRRMLVGRAKMHAALLAQPLAGRFQHDALARRDLAQRRDLLARHDTGIGVRQQAGLAQHQGAHGSEVVDRRLVAQRRQLFLGRAVTQLGLVTQREQRLGAARFLAGPGDRQHLVGRKIVGTAGVRRLREGAVVADIAAQLGQRDEDLSRIRDQSAMAMIARLRGIRHQLGKLRHGHPQENACSRHDSVNRGRPHRVV